MSNFETAGIVGYVEDFKRAKTQLRAKRCCLWMDAYSIFALYSSRLLETTEMLLNAMARAARMG